MPIAITVAGSGGFRVPFDEDQTSYQANVGDITSIGFSVTKDAAADTLAWKVNGVAQTDSTPEVFNSGTLKRGKDTVIELTYVDTSASETTKYTWSFYRNNRLGVLTGFTSLSPAFSTTTTEYTSTFAANDDDANIRARPAERSANTELGSIEIYQNDNLIHQGSATISDVFIPSGTSNYRIVFTDSRTDTRTEYKVTVYRSNGVRNIKVNDVDVPMFAVGTNSYNITVENDVSIAGLDAIPYLTGDEAAYTSSWSITGESTAFATGLSTSRALNEGATTTIVFTFVDTVPATDVTSTYTLTIFRKDALKTLTLSGVSEDDFIFDPAVTQYNINVLNSKDRTTVAATATRSAATVTILPADAASSVDGHQVDLEEGDDTDITVTLTQAEGADTVYTITVHRDAYALTELNTAFTAITNITSSIAAGRPGNPSTAGLTAVEMVEGLPFDDQIHGYTRTFFLQVVSNVTNAASAATVATALQALYAAINSGDLDCRPYIHSIETSTSTNNQLRQEITLYSHRAL